MPAAVKIDKLTSADWVVLRDLRMASVVENPDSFVITVDSVSAMTEQNWRAEIDDANRTVFIATVEGRAIGMVTAFDTNRAEEDLALHGMYVSPAFRRRGIGRLLLDRLVGHAVSLGRTRIVLEVMDSNLGAIRLYDEAGFEPTGRTGALPPPRGHLTDHERARTLTTADTRPTT